MNTPLIYVLINDLGSGGAERQVNYLHQQKLVYKIIILNNKKVFPIPDSDLIPLFKNVSNWKLFRYFIPIIAAYKISKIIKKEDTIISFLELSNITNILLKVIFRKQHNAIVSVRVHPELYLKQAVGPILIWLMKNMYPFANYITSNSVDCCDYLINSIKLPKEKVVHIANMIDIKKVSALTVEYLSADELYLLTIGRLAFQKNIKAQLLLLFELRKIYANLKLYVFGEGPLKDHLISYANELGLKVGLSKDATAAVYFLGHNPDALKYVNEKSIFLLTSLNEGLPNVIVEALARRAVVLSSDCPSGPREILAPNEKLPNNEKAYFGKYGILLPIHNDTEWLNTAKSILKDIETRTHYSEYALTRAQDYDIDTVVLEWKKLISKDQTNS